MSLQYVGDYSIRQVKPPSWSKHYAGEADTCSLTYQGAQYLMKAFLDGLTKYSGMSYTDENGNSLSNANMFLVGWTTDDSPILPTATLSYMGIRGSTIDAIATDTITIQSAQTSKLFTIVDNDGQNVKITVTMSVQYKAGRTIYNWVQLTNPAGTAPSGKNTVRNGLTYTQPPSSNFLEYSFRGQVDADGDPSTTISTADATDVWNTFGSAKDFVSELNVEEIVPAHLWKCASTVDYIFIGQ